MSYCDVCGDLYRVEAATGAAAEKGTEGLVAVCTSCGKVENVVKALDKGTTERTSDSETFLFKFGIEPMNPDGSKFGAVKEVTRERAVVDEKCPKCAHKGLNFYTMQLRSAGEVTRDVSIAGWGADESAPAAAFSASAFSASGTPRATRQKERDRAARALGLAEARRMVGEGNHQSRRGSEDDVGGARRVGR